MNVTTNNRRREASRGSAIIEFVLLCPWILFLMIGVLDLGFYTYAFIATENAARVAALQASAATFGPLTQSNACTAVYNEMLSMPNSSSMSATCNASPLTVTATSGVDSTNAADVTVSVTYQTINLIGIPGLLPQQLTLTRTNVQRMGS